MRKHSNACKPGFRLFDGGMIVAGSMTGSGIFIARSNSIGNIGNAGWVIVIWFLMGFMTLSEALNYRELRGRHVCLKEACNFLLIYFTIQTIYSKSIDAPCNAALASNLLYACTKEII